MASHCASYCEVALPVPLDQSFTYSVPDGASLQPGVRVLAPFGARRLAGVVLRLVPRPEQMDPAKIKPIQRVMDSQPVISDALLRLSRWIADYYLVPQGEVLAAMLPLQSTLLHKTRAVLTDAGRAQLDAALAASVLGNAASEEAHLLQRIARRGGLRLQTLRAEAPMLNRLRRRGWVRLDQSVDTKDSERESEGASLAPEVGETLQLTREQATALARVRDQIEAGGFGVLLLHGVTGSGKTEVYMRAIEHTLTRNRSALMLVPEISLTPAMVHQFVRRFGSRVAVLHSGLGDKDRQAQWQRIHSGGADIVIGTRSAVFAPLQHLGLVIVDEEHDSSYKQEEAPRYNGRDVAIVRAQQEHAAVILGSATPAIESRHHAENGKYQLLELESRVQDRPMPATEIVDMRQEFSETGRKSFLSRRLLEEISARLQEHEQVLILLNRRGFSASVMCRSCGKTIECGNCSIALTHHRREARLLCHYCGFARPVPKVCPECSSEHIYFLGEGSEKVEDALHRHFPAARIGRLDRDTARGRGRAEAILNAFQQHELDILTGTQLIAKGHDIHKVTLVGVVSADIGLARPDFRSAERTFQLLTQVAGRAGRGERAGEVIIQTHYPEHYAIRAAAAQDYGQFYKQEMRFRELMHYPPFSSLANVLIRSDSAETAMRLTGRLGRHLEQQSKSGLRILGPAAAPIARLKKTYRYHFLVKATRRSELRRLLVSCRDFAAREKFPATALVMDVDPQSLL
jgi:primosomal protein N' (replication factor Y)